MKTSKKIYLTSWLPLLLWMLLIFLLSHQDKDTSSLKVGLIQQILGWIGIDGEWLMTGTRGFFLRKLAHFSEYFILLILSFRVANLYYLPPKTFWIPLLGCFLYACTDEFHQTFVPGRVGSPIDVGIDTLGAILGIVVIWSLYRKEILFKL
ncbi:VanZ family protein [bacterium]|nr:VanZ family protein [bacterium]